MKLTINIPETLKECERRSESWCGILSVPRLFKYSAYSSIKVVFSVVSPQNIAIIICRLSIVKCFC